MTTVKIELSDEQAEALRAKASKQGLSVEEYARQVLAHDLIFSKPALRHISERIRERMSKVPPEVMAAMPTDGASQHDHYLYGLPKRTE